MKDGVTRDELLGDDGQDQGYETCDTKALFMSGYTANVIATMAFWMRAYSLFRNLCRDDLAIKVREVKAKMNLATPQ